MKAKTANAKATVPSSATRRIEIRPAVNRNAVILVVGCAGFTAIGAWAISLGNPYYILLGLFSVVFFGFGGVFAPVL